MKISKLIFRTYIMVLSCIGAQRTLGAEFSSGVVAGYNGGLGFQAHYAISGFAKDFPLMTKWSLGFASLDPGKSADARRIFINDATGGVPEKNGWIWNFRLDLLYQIMSATLKRTYLSGGPRYEMFTGHFKYVDGNEEFNVSSRQWGWGIGFDSYFAMGRKIDLMLSGGFEYFLDGPLSGHDTTYKPDGEIINGEKDYTYKDADNAINQPKFVPRLMAGFTYHLGK